MPNTDEQVGELASMLGYQNVPQEVVRAVNQGLACDYLDNLCDSQHTLSMSQMEVKDVRGK